MEKLVITDEELDRRLAAMPDGIAAVYEGTETARFLSLLGKSHNLPNEKISDVARLTGYVLLGFINADEFSAHVLEVVGDQTKADAIGRKIAEKLFLPIGGSLRKLSGRPATPPQPPKLSTPKPMTPLPQLVAGRPPVITPPLVRPPAPSPPPRPTVPSVPPVPSKPVLMPTPPPTQLSERKLGGQAAISEAEADLTLERMLTELPRELRAAVRNVPLRWIIYALGREHQLTIEEIGQLAEGILQFIAGKIHRENLLGTLTKLLKGDRAKAAAAADELNAKAFGPIREAMKRATLPPPAVSRVETPLPPPPQPPTPPVPKKPEPLIIYPLPMAPKPIGTRSQESGTMESELPISKPTVAETMKQKTPSAPPPSIGGPPSALPVYEEVRDKARKEFEQFRAQPKPGSQPPPAKPLGPDPYRESVE